MVMEVPSLDSLHPKVGVSFSQFGNRRNSPFVVDLYKKSKDKGLESFRAIVRTDDPRHFKVNVENFLKIPG